MSASAKFKLLIKAVWLASMIVSLAGCIGIDPSLKIGEQQKVTVEGQTIVYLPMSVSNAIGVNATIIDRFDKDGKLIGHDTVANNGLLETLGGSALTTVVPAASALGLVK